jgi:hypothetical protein
MVDLVTHHHVAGPVFPGHDYASCPGDSVAHVPAARHPSSAPGLVLGRPGAEARRLGQAEW